MKRQLLLLICCCILVQTNVSAGYRHSHKYKYKPLRPISTSESGYRKASVYVGPRAALMKDGGLIGGEGIYSTHFFRQLYGGVQAGTDGGLTKDHFGLVPPNLTTYQISSSNVGVNLTLMFYQTKKVAVMFNLMGDYECLALGNLSSLYNQVFDDHDEDDENLQKPLALNNLFDIRPAIGVDVSRRLSAKVAYNYLLGKPTFGHIEDFRGFQFMLSFNGNKRH